MNVVRGMEHGTQNRMEKFIVEVILFSAFSPFLIGFNSYNELLHIQYFLHHNNNAIYDVNDYRLYQLSSLIRRAWNEMIGKNLVQLHQTNMDTV